MSNDTWSTPKALFERLDEEFRFGHDVCAEDSTTKIKVAYWTIEDDALTKDWHAQSDKTFGRSLWCNPPYSKIGPWIEKAIEAQAAGTQTVMLVMSDPSVKWFSRALEYCSEIRFITNGRIAFEKDGIQQKGNNKGSVIFVFDPHRIGWAQTRYVDRATLV